MNQQETVPKVSSIPTPQTILGISTGWLAISALAAFTSLATLAGLGSLVNIAFPLGCLLVGTLLYFRFPILYVGFLWWIWFLTPLIRRLVDYRSGFTDPSPILLAPLLVTLITLVTLFRNLPRSHVQGGGSFIITFIGILYGYLIGLIKFSPFTATLALFDWLTPVLLGFHLFSQWREYPSYRQNTKRVFVWATLVLGAYGLFQYVTAPEWDSFWLLKTSFTSAGKPEPFMMRIWSTLNSPGPFANAMKSFLILLLSANSPFTISASIIGYSSFLLAGVRSAWGGWLVGLIAYSFYLKPKHQVRLFVTLLVLVALTVPLATAEPFNDKIFSRLETFSDLENDGSATVRKETFAILVGPALSSFIGKGIGDKLYDWGIFAFLFNLGWIGTIFYVGGMILLLVTLFGEIRYPAIKSDTFFYASRAITVSCLVQLPLGSVMAGVIGIFLWGSLSMGLAARKYYQARDSIGNNEAETLDVRAV